MLLPKLTFYVQSSKVTILNNFGMSSLTEVLRSSLTIRPPMPFSREALSLLHVAFSLVRGAITDLHAVVPLLHGHDDVMMMLQMPLQTDVLRVLVRAEVAGEPTLTTALEAHVSCQVVLQGVSLAASGALKRLTFAVARMLLGACSWPVDLRGRAVRSSPVDRGIEARVKT